MGVHVGLSRHTGDNGVSMCMPSHTLTLRHRHRHGQGKDCRSVETLLHKVETVGARRRQRMATDVIDAHDPLLHGTPHIEGGLCRYRASAGGRSRWRNWVINSRGSAVRYASVNDAMPRAMACSRGRCAQSWSKAFCKRTAVGPACRMAWVHCSTT